MMTRLSVLLLFLVGCSAEDPRGTDYLGVLKLSTRTFQLYLQLGEAPSIQNVTVKAEEFPLDTLYQRQDSLYFRSEDLTVAYRGKYDFTTKSFYGQWIIEDTIYRELNFVPVNPDTLTGMHARTAAYQYETPVTRSDGILTGNLRDHGVDKIQLDLVARKIIDGAYRDINSLLISRHGELILEEYFYNFNIDHVYNIQSVNKSLVSALVGIAISKGEINSVKETLCQYLSGYENVACNEQNKSITLRELLTMNTGLPWDEQTYDYMDERNSQSVAANERDQFLYLLSLPRESPPTFAYNSLNHLLINAVLKNTTGLDNVTEHKIRLLAPLGITELYIPEETPMGVIGDIGLRPRDMMKFGQLYLNRGAWDGIQLIPEAWIKESTTPQIKVTEGLSYGYFWWVKDFDHKEGKVAAYFAWGYGGQYIIVVPALELVIVMSGSHWTTSPEGQGLELAPEIINACD